MSKFVLKIYDLYNFFLKVNSTIDLCFVDIKLKLPTIKQM